MEFPHQSYARRAAVNIFSLRVLRSIGPAVCLAAALPLSAQQQSESGAPQYSSSSNLALLGGEDIDGSSIASSPTGALAGAGQYGGRSGGYSGYHESKWSHVAIEAGGGFTAPVGNDVNGGFTTPLGLGANYGTDTWGGNILVGGGWRFSKRFSLLGEYMYNSNKIPGRTLSAVYNSDAADYQSAGIDKIGGNIHTNSIMAEPVFYYYNSDKHSYAGYVLGGVGWAHKTINFTAPVYEQSFYGTYVVNQTFSSYSDSGLAANLGTGISFKPFGSDSQAKLFAEVRYFFADTPREKASDTTNANVLHTGTEGLLPITFGIRF